MRETWGQSLSQEDVLEKGVATHSSILQGNPHGQRPPYGRLQSMGLQSHTQLSDKHFHYFRNLQDFSEIVI